MEKTTLSGVALGAGVGATSAASLPMRSNNGAVVERASLIGAILGGLGGYIFHHVIDSRGDAIRRKTLFNLEAHGLPTNSHDSSSVDFRQFETFINQPQVRENYIETHTVDDGRKLIEGHRVWNLIGQPQFNLDRSHHKKGERKVKSRFRSKLGSRTKGRRAKINSPIVPHSTSQLKETSGYLDRKQSSKEGR